MATLANFRPSSEPSASMLDPSSLPLRGDFAMRRSPTLSLGLDFGTQGISAVVIDLVAAEIVFSHSLNYRQDPRFAGFGLGVDYLLRARVSGEADQPTELYLASLDAMFADLK